MNIVINLTKVPLMIGSSRAILTLEQDSEKVNQNDESTDKRGELLPIIHFASLVVALSSQSRQALMYNISVGDDVM